MGDYFVTFFCCEVLLALLVQVLAAPPTTSNLILSELQHRSPLTIASAPAAHLLYSLPSVYKVSHAVFADQE